MILYCDGMVCDTAETVPSAPIRMNSRTMPSITPPPIDAVSNNTKKAASASE